MEIFWTFISGKTDSNLDLVGLKQIAKPLSKKIVLIIKWDTNMNMPSTVVDSIPWGSDTSFLFFLPIMLFLTSHEVYAGVSLEVEIEVQLIYNIDFKCTT